MSRLSALFEGLLLLSCINPLYGVGEFYKPLPLYTESVQELNTNAIWPTRSTRMSEPGRPENLMGNSAKFDIDQIMNDMEIVTPSANSSNTFFRAQQKDSWISNVKIIPDEHHVSAFLNKGIVKR